MNNETEQETLSSEAVCFMSNHALNHASTDGSKEIQETNPSSQPCDGDSSSQATQKFKVKWTESLESQFYKAIQHIGVHKATPKKILEFMNLDFLTNAHVASKLQKYRQTLKRVKEDTIRKARRVMPSRFSSARVGNNPQHSYNYNTRLGNNNLFNVQPGYGLGQSSLMMNNNAGLHNSLNYMNRKPASALNQTGSRLFPNKGSLGFHNGMEEWRSIPGTSQAPRFEQYGTTNNAVGMNYNPATGSNYAGIKNGDLVGFGGIRANGNGNSNDTLGGIRVHGTGSVGVVRASGAGTSSVGGLNVHSTGNGNESFGNNFGINWNVNNNMISNHGSSTSICPSPLSSLLHNKDQTQNNLIAQTGGVVPALENPRIFDDHHGINEVFNDTINSQFDQSQYQGNMIGENLQVPGAYPLEDINGNNDEEILNSLAANPEMYFPTQDMNFTNHGNNNEEILNSLAANPEMYFPTQDMNITNHGNDNEEILNSLAANPELYFPTQDMNFTNQGNNDEEISNSFAPNPEMYFPTHQDMDITNHGNNNEEILNSLAGDHETYFPTQNVNITNQEHGVVDSTGLPLSLHQSSEDEDFLNYLLDPDMN